MVNTYPRDGRAPAHSSRAEAQGVRPKRPAPLLLLPCYALGATLDMPLAQCRSPVSVKPSPLKTWPR